MRYFADKISFAFVLFGSFLLLLTFLAPPLTLEVQVLLFLSGALLVGLPHGAMDVAVARSLALTDSKVKLLLFLVIYTALALAHYALWWLYPFLGFLLFMGLTVYHFGQDWLSAPWFRPPLFGLAFLVLPAVYHADALIFFFAFLIDKQDAVVFVQLLTALGYPLLLLLILFIVRDGIGKENPERLATAIIFIFSGLLLPPLLFLFLYFCFYHAPKHTAYLFRALRYPNVAALLKSLLPVMLATVALWLLLLWHRDAATSLLSLESFSTLILLIACLTTPHMLLIAYFHAVAQKKMLLPQSFLRSHF